MDRLFKKVIKIMSEINVFFSCTEEVVRHLNSFRVQSSFDFSLFLELCSWTRYRGNLRHLEQRRGKLGGCLYTEP